MRIYVAASFDRKEEANKIKGQVISTWHHEDVEYQPDNQYRAARDKAQIDMCDLFVMLIGDDGGCNRFWELGYAFGIQKQIFLIGQYDRCIFERLCYNRYDTIEEFHERDSLPK